MNPLRKWWRRLGGLFDGQRHDAELASELESHLQLHIEDNLLSGMSPEQARREALMKLGGVEQTKESVRDHRRVPLVENFLQDLHFGARMLRKSPGFTAVTVLTLALGIGATTAIFTVVYAVLLRPLAFSKPEQIVRLWEQNEQGGRMNFADPNFDDIEAQNRSLQGIAEYSNDVDTVSSGGEAVRTGVAWVSRGFFDLMGVAPFAGRSFAPEEQQLDAAMAAMVSYNYWQQALGGTADLSKVHLRVGTRPAAVVGVLPPGFHFPDETEIWVPREIFEKWPSRTAHNWRAVGRVRDDFAVTSAALELTSIAKRLKQQYGQDTAMVAVAAVPLREAMTGSIRPALLILLGASGFLLLIACANVVNLLLAQSATRERELCVRTALGAERGRLIRQFLAESLLLAVLGGTLGVLVAHWGLNALLAIAPKDLPRLGDVSMNLPVLAFSLGISFFIAAGMGTLCAMQGAPRDPVEGLAEGNQRQIGTLRKQRMGRLIVTAQIAITLILLIGTGLMGRSLLRLLSLDPGFRTERVMTMELLLPEAPKKMQRIQFLDELLSRVRTIPGVEAAGATNAIPLSTQGPADGTFVVMNSSQISPQIQDLMHRSLDGTLESDPALMAEFTNFFDALFRDQTHLGDADYVIASDDYFPTLGIPLIRGRMFDARDTFDAPQSALISESLAREKWPNEDPLGHTIEFGNMDGDPRLLTIVGVVGNVRERNLEAIPRPTVYVNYKQRPQAAHMITVVMRTSGKPDAVITAARQIVRDLDPSVPPRFSALSSVYSDSLGTRRFSLTLVGIFSWVALSLAIAGIYGVTAYAVTQRTREIGVRMALGASTREVLNMIVLEGLATATVGVIAGVFGALVLTRWIHSLLYEMSPTDPVTFIGVSLLLSLVALVACYIPARRATRVDPMQALRYE